MTAEPRPLALADECVFCLAAGAVWDPAIGFICCHDSRACSARQRRQDGTEGRQRRSKP